MVVVNLLLFVVEALESLISLLLFIVDRSYELCYIGVN